MSTIQEALQRGIRHHQSGELAAAESLYKQVLQNDARHPDALHLLGLLAHQVGKNQTAVELISHAIRFMPQSAACHNNLGEALRSLGNVVEAERSYRRAVALTPDFPEALVNLGNSLLAQGKLAEAATYFRDAVQQRPDYVAAYNNLGSTLSQLGRMDEAIATYQSALRVDPRNGLTHLNLAFAQQMMGDFAAADSFRTAIECDPANAEPYYQLAHLDVRLLTEDDERAIARLIADSTQAPANRSTAHFAQAAIFDARHEYDAAFRSYQAANEVMAGTYDAQRCEDLVSRIIETFDARFFSSAASYDNDHAPIFLVSMPRSGSTLLEQQLARHETIHAVGELNAVKHLAKKTGELTGVDFPASASRLTREHVRLLGDAYLRRAGKPPARVLDKTLDNFFYLGLVAQLFPQAQVIACRRDPLDVYMSTYARRLNNLPYSSRLANIRHYHIQSERLLAHWEQFCPLPIAQIEYESLVTAPDAVLRQLRDSLGLRLQGVTAAVPRTPIKTASVWQARQPIHGTALGRWSNYRPFVEAALGIEL